VSKVLRELTVVEHEFDLHDRGASFVMRIRPYRSLERVIDGVVITFVDVTARKRAERARGVSERRFAAIVNQAAVGVTETDLAGRYLLTNAAFERLADRSAEDLQRLRRQDLPSPEDVKDLNERFDQALRDGQPFEAEYRLRRADGTTIWVHDTVSVLSDNDGRANTIISVTLEIDKRKRAEEQAGLLLGELDHRVKNILAIVSSIVAQTLKANPSPEVFAEKIAGRITAITRAHGLLTNRGAGGAGTLRNLVETELKPYESRDRGLRVEGPDLVLTPKAGLSLAMAIHELASNAAKYGSLSDPKGKLAVSWAMTEGPDRRLRLSWTETDGPPVRKPPSQTGFGTTLIERSLSFEFDAQVQRSFASSGVVCIIDLPFDTSVGELRPSERGGR
jgi:two-component system CheB/CheR fusion protein